MTKQRVFAPKNCEDCGTEFVPTGTGARYCPDHQIGGRWERENPERLRELARSRQCRYRHKQEWGDPDIYDKLVERFGEKCAICGRSPEPGFFLAVDHNHLTGEVRGLLCQAKNKTDRLGGCNTGLGYFLDDPIRLRAAADYLERVI